MAYNLTPLDISDIQKRMGDLAHTDKALQLLKDDIMNAIKTMEQTKVYFESFRIWFPVIDGGMSDNWDNMHRVSFKSDVFSYSWTDISTADVRAMRYGNERHHRVYGQNREKCDLIVFSSSICADFHAHRIYHQDPEGSP